MKQVQVSLVVGLGVGTAVLLVGVALDSAVNQARGSGGQDRSLDSARIEEITGLKGTSNEEEGVFKVTSPRMDVQVSVDQWGMPPFMGLTSWAGFQAGKKAAAMVMGDLVLFEDEVNPVMSFVLEAGLDVTALHNHFFFDQPKVYFMHIAGEGEPARLATGVRGALDKVKAVRAKNPTPRAGLLLLLLLDSDLLDHLVDGRRAADLVGDDDKRAETWRARRLGYEDDAFRPQVQGVPALDARLGAVLIEALAGALLDSTRRARPDSVLVRAAWGEGHP